MHESDGLDQKDVISHEEATAVAAAVIEAVVLQLEMSESTSDSVVPASSYRMTVLLSSDIETMTELQRPHEIQRQRNNQMGFIEECQGEVTKALHESPRRSKRKRRTVDLLSVSEVLSSRKSPHKRRNVELKMRPAAATARAAATRKEKEKRQQQVVVKKVKSTGSKGKISKTPSGILSPVQDEKKKTPKKKRSSKARRSLEPAYSFESQTKYVSELIKELYIEQEQDDREMYNITKETVVTETSSCKRSQEVEGLNMEEFRRLMTYGEVSVESVASTILPLLNLEEDDIFFDLGCGTGKILVQAALQTPCKRVTGIELMQNRVLEGHKALKRLKDRDFTILHDKQIEIYRGDIFVPPEEARLMDATVVFINNVMFGPALMLKVMELLKDMTNLRCVMTLRKICERHGDIKCTRAGNFCIEYVHPPAEAEIDVSWADKTSVYLYESLDYKLCELRRELADSTKRLTG